MDAGGGEWRPLSAHTPLYLHPPPVCSHPTYPCMRTPPLYAHGDGVPTLHEAPAACMQPGYRAGVSSTGVHATASAGAFADCLARPPLPLPLPRALPPVQAVLLRRTKQTTINGEPIVKLPPRQMELSKQAFSPSEDAYYKKVRGGGAGGS